MKILLSVILSIVFGLLVWLIAHSLLLPVSDAGGSEGHGPDTGSAEWRGLTERKTEDRQREALSVGVGPGAAALIVAGTELS